MVCIAAKAQCSSIFSLLLQQLLQLNVHFTIHDCMTYCTQSCIDIARFIEQKRERAQMSSLDLLLA